MMNFVNFRFLSLEETLENGVDDAQRGGLKGRYAIEAWWGDQWDGLWGYTDAIHDNIHI